jgi:uncharacterized protein (TIGR03083 family)
MSAAPPAEWADARDLVRGELESYLRDASDETVRSLPTRCPPWSVDELTRHLAASARRFNEMLAQGRAGDFTPPFAPDELGEENLRAVREFSGDPLEQLRSEAERFLSDAANLTETMPHQLGPIPVGLQHRFLLADLAIHHDDLAVAAGRRHRPPGSVVEALAKAFEARGVELPDVPDEWERIIAASGR